MEFHQFWNCTGPDSDYLDHPFATQAASCRVWA